MGKVMLTKEELITARTMIAKTPAGKYKLKKLYGSLWSTIKTPTTFGKRFKQSVIAGLLPSISPITTDSDNAWMYRVN